MQDGHGDSRGTRVQRKWASTLDGPPCPSASMLVRYTGSDGAGSGCGLRRSIDPTPGPNPRCCQAPRPLPLILSGILGVSRDSPLTLRGLGGTEPASAS